MRFLPLLLLALVPAANALEWSEIMFDADGRDHGKEWIELIGNTSLSSCTINDLSSSDDLELLQEGTVAIILIVESDHDLDIPEGPWVYGAGKAIGNGLGNTQEHINISCNGTILQTRYDAGEIPGLEPGMSILYDDGWKAGTMNGTLGIIRTAKEHGDPEEEPEDGSDEPEEKTGSPERFCNTTLAITLSATEGVPGQQVMFTVVSDGYAGFMAESNGTIILEGDTLTRRSYSLSLPRDKVKLSAYARQCDARQRAIRYIEVLEPEPVEEPEPVSLTKNDTLARSNETVNKTQPAEALDETGDPANVTVPEVTGQVLYDRDRNVVPWVSAFGMVTLVVSAGLFWQLRRDEG